MTGPYTFESPHAALTAMLELVEPVETERIELDSAGGRVLAEELRADRPSPACDVSAMDGYAVRVSDLHADSLPVAGAIAIGKAPPAMPTGAALRIFTGAPIPDGADAVIKREDVIESFGMIRFTGAIAPSTSAGSHIRRRGENLPAGALVCQSGRIITPALAGSLATFGITMPRVFNRVRVGVVITGDEVVDPGETPDRWRLRDSHASMLGAILSSSPWLERGPIARVHDDPETIFQTARLTLESCDALILTGGVSMGDHDHVPSVVQRLGAGLVFHRLPQRPGKPALGAIASGGKPVFGLPGNPLAVLVTAHRLVLPTLRRRAGVRDVLTPTCVRLANCDGQSIGLWWRRLVTLNSDGEARLIPSQGSGDIASAATSDGFVEIPPNKSGPGPWPFYRW
jgi:molybdopterin molybdotransferase